MNGNLGDIVIDAVNQKVRELKELVDIVHIYVSWDEQDKTRSYDRGSGNLFARRGQVDEWLDLQKETERNYIRQSINPEES